MKHPLSAVLLLVGAAIGCLTQAPRGAAPSAAPIQLTATLVSPIDVELKWKDGETGAAGHVVEWTADLNEGFVILATLPPEVTSYRHSDLMPQTPFHYRIRAYYGPVSNAVPIALPKGLSDAEYLKRSSGEEDFSWAMPTTRPEGAPIEIRSIRSSSTAASAAPAELEGVLMPVTVSGFQLTWTDRAGDEDGYLLETKAEKAPDYTVSAMISPNVNSFGYALSPPVRKASVRVRAYYFGKPSNLESVTTGSRPVEPTP